MVDQSPVKELSLSTVNISLGLYTQVRYPMFRVSYVYSMP